MARRRGLMTISHPPPAKCRRSRTASRIRRLIRFRTTAPPRARGQVNPTRIAPSPLFRRQKAANRGPENLAPLSYTLRKSLERRMRALLGKPAIPLPLVADRELLAPTGPSASDHRAAILGRHAGEKAMRFGAVAVIRLKSTFRHLDLSRPQVSRLARASIRVSVPVKP
jgi:hypothetical protein